MPLNDSAYLAAARAVLATPRDKSSWDWINDNSERFIWDDHGEEAARWNEMAGKGAGFEDVETACEDGENVFMTYRGKTVQVPLEHDRQDNMISIHTLNGLVKNDSELRFCSDSYHSSDVAFLALAPAQWRSLEAEFGREAVAYRFVPIAADLKTFFDEIFADENNRTYPGDEPPPPSAFERMVTRLEAEVLALAKGHVASAEVYSSTVLESFVYLLVVTGSGTERDALFRNAVFRKEVDARRTRWPRELQVQSLSFQSKDVIERDEEAFWMGISWVKGECPQWKWSDGAPDYNARLRELAPPDPKAKALAFLKKHWLVVAFFAFFLGVLLFGKSR